MAIFCVGVMGLSSTLTTAAAATGGGGSGSGGAGSDTPIGGTQYPYLVSPALYPDPANTSFSASITAVVAVPGTTSDSEYNLAVASASTVDNRSVGTLWWLEAAYSSSDAQEIAGTGTCGSDCGQLPLNWSSRSEVESFPGPITALKAGLIGTTPVLGVTAEGVTHLLTEVAPDRWGSLGPTPIGQLVALATEPDEVAVVTLYDGDADVSTVSAAGISIGQATLDPSGPNATAIVDAGVAFAPAQGTYVEGVALAVGGNNEVRFVSSDDGSSFTSPVVVSNYTANLSASPYSQAGFPGANYSGASAGQIAMVAVQGQFFLLFTTIESGRAYPATAASGNDGVSWQGPYFSGPLNGSVLDPELTVSPTGSIYATWEDPEYGPGAVEQAQYFADGYPLQAPQILPGSSRTGSAPVGPPTIAVSGLGQPLLVWPSTSNGTTRLQYSGAYLAPSAALGALERAAETTLSAQDLPANGTSAQVTSLLANVSSLTGRATSNLSSGKLCNAQNLTAQSLYQNLSRFPLSTEPLAGTVCATAFHPNSHATPLLYAEGIDSPNTYLAVYLDWALESEGVGIGSSPLSPVTEVAPYTEMTPAASLPADLSISETLDSKTVVASVQPTPYSPSDYQFVTAGTLPTWTQTTSTKCEKTGGGEGTESITLTTTVTQTWTNLSLNGGAVHSFSGTNAFPSPYVYNLTAYRNYAWKATFAGTTSETEKTLTSCSTPASQTVSVSPVTYGPKVIRAMSLLGNVSTTLANTYSSSFLTADYGAKGTAATLTTSFGTTLPATVAATLANSTATEYANLSTYSTSQSVEFLKAAGAKTNYDLEITSSSRPGSSVVPGTPGFSYGSNGNAPAESVWLGCSFALTPTALPTVTTAPNGPFWANGTTTIDASWDSSADAPGFLTYYEVGSAVNATISDIVPTRVGTAEWNYTVVLHGLEASESYDGTMGVSWSQGCLTDQYGVTLPMFTDSVDPKKSTQEYLPSFEETDLPYDSVSHSGGGIEVQWDAPKHYSDKHLVNGTVVLQSTNGTQGPWSFPFSADQSTAAPAKSKTSAYVELSPPLTENGSYWVSLELNFSTPKKTVLSASPERFVYENDSNGNGLTDAEQAAGWNVTPESCAPDTGSGKSCEIPVRADPGKYSTNGLASDFLEKELGLDPTTFDTAGSDMLDLWNLTFELPSLANSRAQSLLSSDFKLWWENASYDPFDAKAYPTASGPSGHPTATLSSIACTKRSCPAGSDQSAMELFTYSALSQFVNLSGFEPGLRGVIGEYDGKATLTVWGKLSWGASPLATVSSTVVSNVPDGDRIDPVYAKDLYLNIDSSSVCLASDAPSFNFAVEFYVNASAPSGPAEFHDYSQEAEATPGACTDLQWGVDLPVNNSYQYQSVAVAIAANISGRLVVVRSAGDCGWLHISPVYDMFRGDGESQSLSGSCAGGGLDGVASSILEVSLSEDSAGVRAPTYLLVSTGNSTVQSISGGELEYVGERAFDLVVLNVPKGSPVRSDSFRPPWGGANVTFTVGPGLNDFLVPRSMFLGSTLGRALVEDRNMTQSNASQQGVPLAWDALSAMEGYLGYSAGTFPVLHTLSCYWQDRAIPQSTFWSNTVNSRTHPGSICPSDFQLTVPGTASNSPALVNVSLDNASAIANNAGGLPTDPSLETASLAGGALQAVITVNLIVATSQYGQDLGLTPSLDLFLAGLLDNSTGGVNGSLVNVSSYLNTLALPAGVVSQLPNNTLLILGAYGPPQPLDGEPASKCSWYVCILDAVTDWEWIIGGVDYFGGVLLSSVDAFELSYQKEEVTFGLWFIDVLEHPQTAIIKLVTAARVVATNLLNLDSRILEAILNRLLDWIVNPIISAYTSYYERLNVSLAVAIAADTGGHIPESDAAKFWKAVSGPELGLLAILATTIEVVTSLLSDFSFGMGFAISALISLLEGGVIRLAFSSLLKGASEVSDFGLSAARMVWRAANASFVHLNQSQAGLFLAGVGLVGDLVSIQVGFSLLMNSLSETPTLSELAAPIVVLVLASLSLGADVVGDALHSWQVKDLGFFFGIIGAEIGAYSMASDANPNVRMLDGIGVAASGMGALAGLAGS